MSNLDSSHWCGICTSIINRNPQLEFSILNSHRHCLMFQSWNRCGWLLLNSTSQQYYFISCKLYIQLFQVSSMFIFTKVYFTSDKATKYFDFKYIFSLYIVSFCSFVRLFFHFVVAHICIVNFVTVRMKYYFFISFFASKKPIIC